MSPDALVALLAEPDRMKVFAAVVLGATTLAEVAERTGVAKRTAAAAVRRLTDGGLLGTEDDRLIARLDLFKQVVKESGANVPRNPSTPTAVARPSCERSLSTDGSSRFRRRRESAG